MLHLLIRTPFRARETLNNTLISYFKRFSSFHFRQILIRIRALAYLCPNSCVIVCANVIPLSSLTLQLRSGWHMPATCATPKVLQILLREQMSFLVTKIATS